MLWTKQCRSARPRDVPRRHHQRYTTPVYSGKLPLGLQGQYQSSLAGGFVVAIWGYLSGRDCGGTLPSGSSIRSICMVIATTAEKR